VRKLAHRDASSHCRLLGPMRLQQRYAKRLRGPDVSALGSNRDLVNLVRGVSGAFMNASDGVRARTV
jgi:hypothetical protein